MHEHAINFEDPQYRRHVVKVHKTPRIFPSQLDKSVLSITGQAPVEYERIIGGETNQVYKVILSDQTEVIVKATLSPISEFERARWAMEQCSSKYVNVPKVYGIVKTDGGSPITVAVEEKVDGIPLSELGTLHSTEARRMLSRVGSILSIVHSIQTQGFGTLDGNGNGRYQSIQQLLGFHINDQEKYMDIVNRLAINPDIVNQSLKVLADELPKIRVSSSVLCHNDLSPWHIIYNQTTDQISLIDFGQAKALVPPQDIVKWEMWHGKKAPVNWLLEGYSDPSVFQETALTKLLWIDTALKMLQTYEDQNYPEAIHLAIKGLQRGLTL